LSPSLLPLRRRTSPHNDANADPGRSQLLSQALQASFSGSSLSPGSSLQYTGVQRLLGCSMGATFSITGLAISSDCCG
jgi:hypothetical protein